MVHKDKLWIKFDNNLDIECLCAYNNRRCSKEGRPNCLLYLAKFIQIGDEARHEERVKLGMEATKKLEARIKREQKKFESQVKKSIKKFKI